ncbi:MAG: 1-deoxy-D-xylulose-5-phosphate reductoisomerase [Nitrospirae bacterium]|nr:1-deoxy-D-xylulose-5-phosphate reductoisomerase [Nitrospirota bacterium]
MKRVVILGSTGSIGRMALEVISKHRDEFSVVGLAAGSNVDLIEQQAKTFHPEIVGVADEKAARELGTRLGRKIEVCAGQDGVAAVAAHDSSDFVLSAMVGFSGLLPTLRAIERGKVIGLANKETLVVAGSVVTEKAREHGARILPVDSEHSAIFQCIGGYEGSQVKRIILTASGGPFMGKTGEDLKNVSPEQALRHPKWSMGRKISIDSSTLMNKGLEVIEASHLFGLDAESIAVVIHPQSIVHSLVEFVDGTLLAQMSHPDMKGPIAYALSYPRRLNDTVPRLELETIGALTFHKPDAETFPCLGFAYGALKAGGTMPAVLNAANEILVNAFLERRIDFTGIPGIIKRVMDRHDARRADTLDAVIEADRWAREKANEYIGKR